MDSSIAAAHTNRHKPAPPLPPISGTTPLAVKSGFPARPASAIVCGMTTQEPPRNGAHHVLRFLRKLDTTRSGYAIHGVHGWALTADVEARSGLHVPELLPSLARTGLLDRQDVRVPGQPRPVWAYRINQRGVDRVSEMDGREPYEVEPPHPPRPHLPVPAHVPTSCLRVLDELRRTADDPTSPTPFPGEPGWLTSRELDERILNAFDDVDLAWLHERGLTEKRRHLPSATARRPNVYYRITAAGRVLRPLLWNESAAARRVR